MSALLFWGDWQQQLSGNDRRGVESSTEAAVAGGRKEVLTVEGTNLWGIIKSDVGWAAWRRAFQ